MAQHSSDSSSLESRPRSLSHKKNWRKIGGGPDIWLRAKTVHVVYNYNYVVVGVVV